MDFYNWKFQCRCGLNHIIPITPKIEAEAKKDYDLAEESAQTEYNRLWLWLHSASLWDLIKFWLMRMTISKEVKNGIS